MSKGSRPRTDISFWITTSLSTVEMASLIPQMKKRALRLQRSEVTTVITKKITGVTRRALLVNNQLQKFKKRIAETLRAQAASAENAITLRGY